MEMVDFVTSPGSRVQTVVSTHGVYQKRPGVGEELVLTGAFESAGDSPEEVVDAIRARCEWPLHVADPVAWLPRATEQEIALLRLFDPTRSFLGKGHRGANGSGKNPNP